ncbi:MAG: hypothetical protein ACO1SX_02805 [Actinomycetota bacterium]
MPGIAPARKNARWISLAALLAYLGVLTLVTFGDHCVAAVSLSPQGDCPAGAASHGPTVTVPSASAAEHACLACALVQQTASPGVLAASAAAPVIRPAIPSSIPTPFVRAADFPPTPPRGPPHA